MNWNDMSDLQCHLEDELRTGAFEPERLACGDVVIHPVDGKGTIFFMDTGYAHERGWICCKTGVFSGDGMFCCYPDEVERTK